LNKIEYRRECLKRNTDLQEDVLLFHKEFPPVFARDLANTKCLPHWLRPILEQSKKIPSYYIGRPRTFKDLKTLRKEMTIRYAGFQIIEVGSKRYFEALEKNPYEYSRQLRSYLKKWPNVRKEFFLHGIFESYLLKHEDFPYIFSHVRKTKQGYEARCLAHDDKQTSLSISEADDGRILICCSAGCSPKDIINAVDLSDHFVDLKIVLLLRQDAKVKRRSDLVVSDYPVTKGATSSMRANLTRKADEVKIWIPIYEDTSRDDVNWEEIAGLQNSIYGVRKQPKETKYLRKLRVWDMYSKTKNYAEVGRRLASPRTTVEELYISVFKDIMGTIPQGKLREKRAIGTSENHFEECQVCKSAKRPKDLCPAGRALVDINCASQREETGKTRRYEDDEFDIIDNVPDAAAADEDSIISKIDNERKAKRG
jgi:hypothetical protein